MPAELKKYMSVSQGFSRMPENQYSHAWSLLSSKGREISQESNYNDLLDPNIFLGFITDDALLRFYQNDAMFLTNLFAMGKNSKEIFEVFKILYNVWILEIRISSNKNGAERRLQHSFGGGAMMESMGRMLAEEKQKSGKYEKMMQDGGMYQ